MSCGSRSSADTLYRARQAPTAPRLNFFTSREAVARWAAAHPTLATPVLDL